MGRERARVPGGVIGAGVDVPVAVAVAVDVGVAVGVPGVVVGVGVGVAVPFGGGPPVTVTRWRRGTRFWLPALSLTMSVAK
jgi:hypothetical protein